MVEVAEVAPGRWDSSCKLFVFSLFGDHIMVAKFISAEGRKKEGEEEKKRRREEEEEEEEEEGGGGGDTGEGRKKKKKKRRRRRGREGKRTKKGIAMASLITKDPQISDTVNNMFRIFLGCTTDAYLELARFESATLIRTFDLRYDLISALVERWCPETYTFHLPCGECTVTLEDVALQLGLPIDGSAVTGVTAIAEPTALCYSLLGALPGDDESNFSGLKFIWLKANFEHLSVNATEKELICVAQAYIIHIIWGVLMLDANKNRVYLQYLPLLVDLRNVHSYSWGSTVLAMLYRDLCRTTKPDAVDIGGCLILL
ncbi:hypothetical protein PVK06_016890 [Gossypium arboreum]|uniref:Aminotransferase-like plant mobile domain-containing protein n=1 Tax=Gossypium arboreum TaxID=29729 RepID=A0ABR0Q2C0_GOSAR|nr:hypothetical protein PVK06_016890 [Gossypium arboreum]